MEEAGDYTSRLALVEEFKSYPYGAVWDYYCALQGTPVREQWLAEVKAYEQNVLSVRSADHKEPIHQS
ncbi:L-rhamnose isomerase [compost metagenome]